MLSFLNGDKLISDNASRYFDELPEGSNQFISLSISSVLIEKWLQNKKTIEFIGSWEQLNYPGFNSPDFEGIKSEAGLNRFTLSVKKWIEKTNVSDFQGREN